MKHLGSYSPDKGLSDCAYCEGLPQEKLGPLHVGVRFGDGGNPVSHFTLDGEIIPVNKVVEAYLGPRGWIVILQERNGHLFACEETYTHAFAVRREGHVQWHWYPHGARVPQPKPLTFPEMPPDL